MSTSAPQARARRARWPRRDRIAQAEWQALAGDDRREAAALRSALVHIEHLERSLAEERDRAFDRRAIAGGGSRWAQEQARARLQARSIERLAACNVEGVERRWSADGFASLDDFGVPAPVLVLGVRASRDRSNHVDHRFASGRRWIALDHRCSDGIVADHLALVATPLDTDMATHHRIGRLTQLVAGRSETVGALCEYRAVVNELFEGSVSVDRQRGPVGGGCWPVDLDSLPALTGIEVDEVDRWAEPDQRAPLTLGTGWRLLILGPSIER